jgi:hypothetical protein
VNREAKLGKKSLRKGQRGVRGERVDKMGSDEKRLESEKRGESVGGGAHARGWIRKKRAPSSSSSSAIALVVYRWDSSSIDDLGVRVDLSGGKRSSRRDVGHRNRGLPTGE